MPTKPIPPAQRSQIIHVIDHAHSNGEQDITVYRDKKHNFLVASLYQYGQGRTTITPAGEAKYIGAGPVDEEKWTKIEFEYIPMADRMLIGACLALDSLPNAQMAGWWIDTHRLAQCINALLTQQYGKTAADFAAVE